MQVIDENNSTQPKDGKVRIFIYVLTVVVVVALIACSYYLGLKSGGDDDNEVYLSEVDARSQKNEKVDVAKEENGWVTRGGQFAYTFEYPYGWHVASSFEHNFTRISEKPIWLAPSGPRLDLIEFSEVSGENGLEQLLQAFDSAVGIRNEYQSTLLAEDAWRQVYEYRRKAHGGDYLEHDAVGYYVVIQTGPSSNTQSSCDVNQRVFYSHPVDASLVDQVEVLKRVMLSLDMNEQLKTRRAEICAPLFAM
jgi:hypothetical protein